MLSSVRLPSSPRLMSRGREFDYARDSNSEYVENDDREDSDVVFLD